MIKVLFVCHGITVECESKLR